MSQTKAQLIDPVDGTIVNADINASAAIAGTKISPDFGSQAISTTGGLSINGATVFNESGADVDFRIEGDTDTNLFRLDASVDRIGIGISAPQQKLHIAVSDSGAANIAFTNSTTGSGSGDGLVIGLTGGEDGQINMQESANLKFSTADEERLRIDNTGKVGLGLQNSSNICDPDGNGLLIRAASTVGTTKGHIMLSGDSATVDEGPQIVFSESGSGSNFAGAYVGHRRSGSNSIGSLVFGVRTTSGDTSTVPTEVMRINPDLKVAIGSTSASSTLQVFGVDTTIGVHTYPQLTLQTASTDGAADKGSGIMFLNHDGSSGKFGGNIRVLNENATSGNHASYMAFSTRPAGGSVNEAMRINSSSNLLIATTTTLSNGAGSRLQIVPANGDTAIACKHTGTNDGNIIEIQHQRAGTNSGAFVGTAMSFRQQDGTQVGTIQIANTATNYNTSSDYRLKENEVAISDGITRLKTLKPYRFNFKGDSKIVDGFFAHEVTAVPEAISGTKDEVDSNGDPKYQGIDQSKLVPLLVAAVKELITKVETLEAA